MRRITLLVIAVGFGALASVASAHPGASAGRRTAPVRTTWSAEYDASSYYGAVKCTGKTVVSNKYPGGKDTETCEAVGGTLAHVVAGKGQHAFENTEGGTVNEWESDSGDGKRTTDYSYSVNKKLTKFKLVAIYAAPEP